MGLEILKRKKFNGDHSFRTQGCKTAKTLRRKTLTVVSFLSTHDKNPQSIEKQWVADFSYSLFTLNSLDNALDFQSNLKIKRVHFFKELKKAEQAAASSVPQAGIPALSSDA